MSKSVRRSIMRKIVGIMLLILPLALFGDREAIGYLGVSTQGLSEAMKIALAIDHGVLVEKVHDDTPAEKGGIQVGDIITQIDKADIIDYRTLKKVVKERPDERVAVTIYRRGKKMSKMVTLGAREKSKLSLEIDIPDIIDLKTMLGTEKLQENIDDIKNQIEQLKIEIEQIKNRLK